MMLTSLGLMHEGRLDTVKKVVGPSVLQAHTGIADDPITGTAAP
ncbi:hypothetical protein [Streptomyces sp. NPDC060035]